MSEPLTIERIAEVGLEPIYTPHGYVIKEDGTILSLVRRYYHGVACALLYPEIAKEVGLPPLTDDPDDAPDVYLYQAFEHDEHHRMPVIRVSMGLMTGGFYLNKGYNPATPAQIEAVKKVLRVLGIKGVGRKVETEFGTLDVKDMLDKLLEDEHWREEYRRESVEKYGTGVQNKLAVFRAFEGKDE